MANANTQLYATQGNGGKSSVSLQEIADFTATVGGDVKTVCGVSPNAQGNVVLGPTDVGAFPADDVSTIGNNLITAPDQQTALTTIGALASNGTAVQAAKLATARSITLTGNASGSTNFDGSANVSINVTIPTGTTSVAGIFKVGRGLGLESAGVLALAAPGGGDLGGIYQPTAASGLDVTNGTLTAPGLVKGTTGTTAARPTLAAANAGYAYFDTTLNKPIWWKGDAWVDATGTAA